MLAQLLFSLFPTGTRVNQDSLENTVTKLMVTPSTKIPCSVHFGNSSLLILCILIFFFFYCFVFLFRKNKKFFLIDSIFFFFNFSCVGIGMLNSVCVQLSYRCLFLLIITPHKRPVIMEKDGWNLLEECKEEKIRFSFI